MAAVQAVAVLAAGHVLAVLRRRVRAAGVRAAAAAAPLAAARAPVARRRRAAHCEYLALYRVIVISKSMYLEILLYRVIRSDVDVSGDETFNVSCETMIPFCGCSYLFS